MKKVLIALVLLLVVAYFGYNYVMAPPKNISTSKADFKLNAADFSKEFSSNLADAEKKYGEKVVTLKGTITEVETGGITLNKSVFCKLDDTANLKTGTIISVKGLFIGYDELLEVIKLDQCSIER